MTVFFFQFFFFLSLIHDGKNGIKMYAIQTKLKPPLQLPILSLHAKNYPIRFIIKNFMRVQS